MTRVLVWNEGIHEKRNEEVRAVYPDGIHGAINQLLKVDKTIVVRTATLADVEHGLTEAALAQTDVLIWWGHLAHQQVADEAVARVQARVLQGMGLIVLHSGHLSKIFQALMGTTCNLRWREADDREVIWTVAPDHPIVAGVPQPLVLPRHEMYGEYFDIPAPDELVFVSNFTGGEVFRSGCCFRRGKGRVFYFSPGHETYPIYHRADIGRVLINAVHWAHVAVPHAVITTQSPNDPLNWFVGETT
ncbi:MAG: trehalose utilization protein ThuA [Gammaproteobacteria bacterium]|nr:trehalose utilization protein ThuA [Gammaproteobacteria bacterium]